MSNAAFAAALIGGLAAVPAAAQDHAGHAGHAMPAPEPAPQSACEAEAARHRAMGHPVPEGACAPAASLDPEGHEGMDHSAGHHPGPVAVAIPSSAPPPNAGPPRAADAIWGTEAMQASRAALVQEHGGMRTSGLRVDRFEYRPREGDDAFLWDAEAWYGGDLNRIWLESEGEGTLAGGIEVEHASAALLYGHAISPWFDLKAGVRQALAGPARTYLDVGVEGLAPYLFHIEGNLLLSHKGELTAEAEVELDQRITQRLILQPRAEIALSAQDIPDLGIGAGIDRIGAGVRLRYEIAREFAPYLGVEHERRIGQSGDYARAAGEDPASTSLVVGLRFWF